MCVAFSHSGPKTCAEATFARTFKLVMSSTIFARFGCIGSHLFLKPTIFLGGKIFIKYEKVKVAHFDEIEENYFFFYEINNA